MRLRAFVFAISFLVGSLAFAAQYYVDCSCGTNGDGSTTTCGASGPKNSIANINSASGTGDSLLFARGTTCEASDNALQLRHQMTVDAYGTGNRPIIEGGHDADTGWTEDTGTPPTNCGSGCYKWTVPGSPAAGDWEMLWDDGVAQTRTRECGDGTDCTVDSTCASKTCVSSQCGSGKSCTVDADCQVCEFNTNCTSTTDVAGEFCYDGSGTLYYESASAPSGDIVFAENGSNAIELVAGASADGGSVKNVYFKYGGQEIFEACINSGVTPADWLFEDVKWTHASRHAIRNYCNVVEPKDGSTNEVVDWIFRRNHFERIGDGNPNEFQKWNADWQSYGMWFATGCDGVIIEDSYFFDIQGGGISLGGEAMKGCIVRNNTFVDLWGSAVKGGGETGKRCDIASDPAPAGATCHVDAECLCGTPTANECSTSGSSCTTNAECLCLDQWDPTGASPTIIEGNTIADCSNWNFDISCVHTFRKVRVRGNDISDCAINNGALGHCFQMDNGSYDSVAENNRIRNASATSGSGISIINGQRIDIINNDITDSAYCMRLGVSGDESTTDITVWGNICRNSATGEIWVGQTTEALGGTNEINCNSYTDTTGTWHIDGTNKTWATWQSGGFGADSMPTGTAAAIRKADAKCTDTVREAINE